MHKLFLFFALFPCIVLAQNQFPKRHIQIFAGRSFNGTGDIRGFAFSTEYGQYFRKKCSWYGRIGGTIHDTFEGIYYTDQSGNPVDASVRATIAGFEVSGIFGYSFIRNKKNECLIRIGPLFRYQSTSYWDVLGIFPPGGTGLPIPVVSFINLTPQRTFALGANLGLGYNYIISKNVTIGIIVELQTDTNGDTINQLLFSVGKRF